MKLPAHCCQQQAGKSSKGQLSSIRLVGQFMVHSGLGWVFRCLPLLSRQLEIAEENCWMCLRLPLVPRRNTLTPCVHVLDLGATELTELLALQGC